MRYAGFSPCFRREAGTYGKDTKGLVRVHQFDKVEQFSFAHPDDSWDEYETIRANQEAILQALEIPYRVLVMCAGDLGGSAAKKVDHEAWLPGAQRLPGGHLGHERHRLPGAPAPGPHAGAGGHVPRAHA